jgi:hypothetical protein
MQGGLKEGSCCGKGCKESSGRWMLWKGQCSPVQWPRGERHMKSFCCAIWCHFPENSTLLKWFLVFSLKNLLLLFWNYMSLCKHVTVSNKELFFFTSLFSYINNVKHRNQEWLTELEIFMEGEIKERSFFRFQNNIHFSNWVRFEVFMATVYNKVFSGNWPFPYGVRIHYFSRASAELQGHHGTGQNDSVHRPLRSYIPHWTMNRNNLRTIIIT